ncbi:MAG: 4Fe-4S binding protein [Deltaproteobacteria bacterium]|nr:4Fe-4S binding protein [Deltaproteobacteria bacterium]MBN2671196.1 4Fe-4S binding protein [Deltaproteobacteria bacterium]
MPKQDAAPKWQDLALGCATLEPGSSKYQKTGDWRSSRPVWNFDQCVKCGVCTVFCPEGCLSIDAKGYPQVDLDYCKGCAICVTECWTGCISMEEEKD